METTSCRVASMTKDEEKEVVDGRGKALRVWWAVRFFFSNQWAVSDSIIWNCVFPSRRTHHFVYSKGGGVSEGGKGSCGQTCWQESNSTFISSWTIVGFLGFFHVSHSWAAAGSERMFDEEMREEEKRGQVIVAHTKWTWAEYDARSHIITLLVVKGKNPPE